MTILAGDVGGTKILLEAGDIRSGAWSPQLARRYESSEVTFAEAIAEFMREWDATRKSTQRIASAAFGAAGPVVGNKVKMTNRPWSVDGDMVMRRFGVARVLVVNDLQASARGLELLAGKEMRTIQPGKAVEGAPCVVLGVGTGLGIAYLFWTNGGYRPIAGEGGHATFAPVTPQQLALAESIRVTRGRVSNEDILSGPGLSRVYQFMSESGQCGTPAPDALLPERISRGAIEAGDPMCGSALDVFIECLGSVAGDHALNVMARGGVYLTGGIVAKILPRLKDERFRAAFCAKGAHSSMLQRIPVRAVTSERLPVLGAARFASDR
ncbi:MAG: ROK family protein [Bacillota bacterium]